MRSRSLFAVLTVCAALLLGALAVELAFRAFEFPFRTRWSPSESALARFDAELGWTYVPDHSAVQRFGSAERPVAMHFDAIGARVRAPGVVRDPAAPTLLLVGCSTTMGHGLPYEETFAGRLEDTPGFPYQVVNLGVQAYGTDQALLMLKRQFDRFDTRAVVYGFVGAHVRRNANADRRLLFPRARFVGTKPLFALRDGKELYLTRRPRRYDERIACHVCDALRFAWTRFGPEPDLALTRALILAMKRYAESRGASFTLVHWRFGSQPRPPGSFLGIPLDLVDTGADAPPGWSAWRIPGDGHPDARAHARVARLLAGRLAPETD